MGGSSRKAVVKSLGGRGDKGEASGPYYPLTSALS